MIITLKKLLRQLILSTLLGGLALVVWGMIFWGFLADPVGVFHTLPNADAVTALLQANGTTTGTYFMPWPRKTAEEFAAFVAQHQRGPFYLLMYIREGVDPNSPGKLLLGVLHYLTVALLATLLLLMTNLPRYGSRVLVVLLAGLLGSNFITLGNPLWFHLPWDYTLGNLFYEVVSWLLLGLVTAPFVRPA
ncbi:MAG: hypothetical protein R3C14_50940 [Caldilineaceae bacterium]